MTTKTKTIALALAAAFSLGTGAADAATDPVAQFYKGKRMQMLVGSGPGGGYDIYARLVTRHISRYIPGNPRFITKNMDGAGSIVVMNFVANVAPKDGTVIAALQRSLALVQIMGQQGPRFKAQELNWLGSLANEAGVCAIAKRTGIKSFEDAFTREFVMGGTGPNDTEIQPALLNNTLGTKFKLIKGYPSTPPAHLGIQRGELDGICQSWSSFKEQAGKYLTDGHMVPVLQMSLKPHPELAKMGVPMVFDYVKADRVVPGMKVEDVESHFRLVMASKAMGRPFALAPGVPADRVKAVRVAFSKMTEDPKFIDDAKRLRREVDLVTGDEIQAIVEKMAATPKNVLANLDDLMKFKGTTGQAKVSLARHTGKVVAINDGGRAIVIDYQGKKVEAKVSGSRTKLSVGGKKAKRDAVKAGMTCTFVYTGPGAEAKEVDCKS